tara:strand:+ start:65 stop:325 length:261 start_codon:yes stop_codon:yes gene_type:complete
MSGKSGRLSGDPKIFNPRLQQKVIFHAEQAAARHFLMYPQNIVPSGRITPKGGRISLLVAAFGDTVFVYSSGGCPVGKTNMNTIEP